MANTTIDTLEVKISANAQSATASLNSLAKALSKVKTALSSADKDGLKASDHLAKSLNEMNGALNTITTSGIKKLQKLANGIKDYTDSVKALKDTGVVSKHIRNVESALSSTKKGKTTATGEGSDAVKESASTATGAVSEMAETLSDTENVMMGFGIHLKNIGLSIKNFGNEIKKSLKSLKSYRSSLSGILSTFSRIAMYRAIRTAIKEITEAFSEGLKNAYMYSKQSETFTRLAEALDRMASLAAQMRNQLGAFWGEVKQFIMPAVEWLIEKVRFLAERVTEFFAALNGQPTYQRALLVAVEWEEATDALMKYKHQLLGLDELNNLSAQKNSGKDDINYKELFEEVEVNSKLKAIGGAWGGVVQTIKDHLDDIENFMIGAFIGVGAILLFSGANIPLGLGLLIKGAWDASEKFPIWNSMSGEVSTSLADIQEVVGGLMAGIGIVLLLSGAAPQLGIGMIIAGASNFFDGVTKKKTDWTKIDKKTSTAIQAIKKTLGVAMSLFGAIMILSGANVTLGLGCLIGGITWLFSDAKNKKTDWTKVDSKVGEAIKLIHGTLLEPIGLLAVGAVLMFTGHYGLGMGLIMASGVLAIHQISEDGWDGALKNLKTAWNAIRQWFKGTVQYDLNKWSNAIEEAFFYDLNGNGKIGGLATTPEKGINVGSTTTMDYFTIPEEPKFQGAGSPGALTSFQSIGKAIHENRDNGGQQYTTIQGMVGEQLADRLMDAIGNPATAVESIADNWLYNLFQYLPGMLPTTSKMLKAGGGIPTQGTLFYAGEAGPEFVGAMGNSSAVANTGQMTDAIRQAAYEGVSQAMRENGGNGLDGYEPATGDDVFLFFRKKANSFNKRTGSSAFA